MPTTATGVFTCDCGEPMDEFGCAAQPEEPLGKIALPGYARCEWDEHCTRRARFAVGMDGLALYWVCGLHHRAIRGLDVVGEVS